MSYYIKKVNNKEVYFEFKSNSHSIDIFIIDEVGDREEIGYLSVTYSKSKNPSEFDDDPETITEELDAIYISNFQLAGQYRGVGIASIIISGLLEKAKKDKYNLVSLHLFRDAFFDKLNYLYSSKFGATLRADYGEYIILEWKFILYSYQSNRHSLRKCPLYTYYTSN